jgi:hypothetical protein
MAAFAATSERLVIPLALPQGALAEFAVLAALVIAPMRMLQMAVQRTLTPRLRDATSAAARRHLLLQEVGLAAGLVAVLSLALWYAAPLAVSLLLGGKYSFAPALILAALVSGAVRAVNGFSNGRGNGAQSPRAAPPRQRLGLARPVARSAGRLDRGRMGADRPIARHLRRLALPGGGPATARSAEPAQRLACRVPTLNASRLLPHSAAVISPRRLRTTGPGS